MLLSGLKVISILSVKPPEQALVEDKLNIIQATSQYGKGTVFAIDDPCICNGYIVNELLNR
ncbi:hypothetical protein [Ferruginibacter sp.]|uniref:hypothetical protein n=1 Tax=Ferruginibacter sp. TaxID=1940288 RepID=UPI0019B26F3B|nr:hypothetical protein [Ferruginibacter sp.]MBC7626134.1 hypothetical protein [Ferruginibacter sp.]